MAVKKSVAAAITTAVQLYMEAEQQIIPAAAPEPGMPRVPSPAFSPWAIAGRQTAMEMRRLLQMRLVR
jgi:hypothetical protein